MNDESEQIINILRKESKDLVDRIESIKRDEAKMFILLYLENGFYHLVEALRRQNPDLPSEKIKQDVGKAWEELYKHEAAKKSK